MSDRTIRALTCTVLIAAMNMVASASGTPGTRVVLGLGDAAAQLRQARIALDDTATTPTTPSTERVASRLEAVASYMRRVAEASPSRVRYRWVWYGKQRVTEGPLRLKVYRASGVVRGATAVRFLATRGDVYLISMTVRDAEGRDHSYTLNRWVVEELPRQQVVYFDRPLDVASITMSMRHDSDDNRRMTLSLGIPDRPEYAREIVQLCNRSRAALSAARLDEVREILDLAVARLDEYRRTRERIHQAPESE